MASVAHDEDSRSVIELVDDALFDAILADPVKSLDVPGVWSKDLLHACLDDLE